MSNSLVMLIVILVLVSLVGLVGFAFVVEEESVAATQEHDDGGEDQAEEHDHDDGEEMMHGFLETFGPGIAPHYHALDYTEFENVADISRNPAEVPPPLQRNFSTTVTINLEAKEVISEIAPGITYHYWTFGGKIPGPFLRVRQGDTVELTLSNHLTNSHNHSIDLHAVTGPGGGSVLTNVIPGESKTLRFKALKPGLFIYHCATHNVPLHMTNGLYGMILVEPEEGFPEVDKEFYVMQGELYTEGAIGEVGFQAFNAQKMLDEDPEYVVFNGRVNSLVDNPLTASVGDNVRLYVGNAGVSLISSFHVIGEIFDTVYPEASTPVKNNVQTTLIPAGGATIAEFEIDYPGTYILVDHSLARLDRGAWGLLTATGTANPEIYSAG